MSGEVSVMRPRPRAATHNQGKLMESSPLTLLVVHTLFVAGPAAAEDCIPSHLSLAESGLLDPQVRKGPDVPRLSSSEDFFGREAADWARRHKAGRLRGRARPSAPNALQGT
ncbi:MAG: hypothetical protein AUK47_25680 [Deltaproteobacteria bacterium CG2_30_63_29]|nr:MAG: hypothetical protein AUK47_25680 [Deltaproteobacteria bacterium CG2_30_63_29]PJB33250.1 MAG: hypothetical protein CO108_31320 [Deltaproteobacteria bacterium CG_4_9_14_3_um_filter_63_12]